MPSTSYLLRRYPLVIPEVLHPCDGPRYAHLHVPNRDHLPIGGAPMREPPPTDLVAIRPARVADAVGIAAVHVAAWRSAYPGILPDHTLTGLSAPRQAAYYAHLAARAGILHVAEAREDRRILGFVSASRSGSPIADGEIETLYVADDWRDQGIGRLLLHAAATSLAEAGCESAFLWVLSENPSRWFYERMGGERAMTGHVSVGGRPQPQTAYRWRPIERLMESR